MLTGLARRAARVATGSTYVILGLDAARTPGARIEMAAPTLAAMRKVMPLPADDEMVVRANAAVQTAAGAVLISGRSQRLAPLVLIASLVPTTVAGHAFWKIDDPIQRKVQRIQFQKNIALVGGLLFALCDDHRPER